MSHTRAAVLPLNITGRRISVLFTVLLSFLLFSGILVSTSQETPEPDSTDHTAAQTEQGAINWPDARSVRFYDRDGKDFKYHRIIDWGAYERWNRTGLNQGVNHQKQIDWQDLGDQPRNRTVEPTGQGHNVSPNEQSGLVANTSSDSNNRSTKSTRKQPQTSVRDTEQASSTSENGSVKDQGTSNERNISARTKQDRAPDRSENGQRIDWMKKKRQSAQEPAKPDPSAQTAEVVDTNTQRNQSDTKVRTIYLDEIDWQRVPRN